MSSNSNTGGLDAAAFGLFDVGPTDLVDEGGAAVAGTTFELRNAGFLYRKHQLLIIIINIKLNYRYCLPYESFDHQKLFLNDL